MSTTPAPGTAEGEGRFWSKVHRGPEGACWIWLGAIADDGYGRYYLHDGAGGMVRPHRYAYALAREVELEELDELMHSCDVPVCVNPSHLMPGNHTENMRDRARRAAPITARPFASVDYPGRRWPLVHARCAMRSKPTAGHPSVWPRSSPATTPTPRHCSSPS